jgi:hypothetical protein
VSYQQKEEYGNISVRTRKPDVKFTNGLNTIYGVDYNISELEANVIMVNVVQFDTENKADKYSYQKIDILKTKYGILSKGKRVQMSMLTPNRR